MPLDLGDRRQKAFALQAFPVEVRRPRVRRGDQHDAARKERAQQIAENHRIADVADEEFVEHEHAHLVRNARGHDFERIAAAFERSQPGMHFLHEAVEMHAALAWLGRARRAA